MLGTQTGSLLVWLNRGKDTAGHWLGFAAALSGASRPPACRRLPRSARSRLADVNHDTLPDLIVSTAGVTGQTAIFLNQGRPSTSLTGALLTSATTAQVTSTAGFDASGTLLIGGKGGDTVDYSGLTRRASPASTTGAPARSPSCSAPAVTPSAWQGFATSAAQSLTTPSPTALAVGDLTGDGFADLVVTGATNQLYTGKNDGTFVLNSAALGSGGTAVAIADVNGDHLLDLVIGGTATTTKLYLNQAKPTHDPQQRAGHHRPEHDRRLDHRVPELGHRSPWAARP